MLRMLHDMSYLRTIVATITNTDDGMTVEVSYASARYCVRMRDDDSGNWLPVARVYSTEVDALAYAHKIIGVTE
jgi:hypothetical protein